METPRYILIAGVNGSGKSTIYHYLWKEHYPKYQIIQ